MSNSKTAGQWFRRVLETATSLGGLRTAIALVVEELGFDFYIIQSRSPVQNRVLRRTGDVLLGNAPMTPREFRREARMFSRFRDMARRQLSIATPTLWREMEKSEPELSGRMRHYGLMTGCTHVVHGQDQAWSLMSFILNEEGPKAEARIDAALPLCQLFACHAHDAIARVALPLLSASRPTEALSPVDGLALSPRERQCLTLAGVGMTAAEIARHLGIAERTAIYHLMVARRKLGSNKTRQAFTKAVALGLISARG